MPPAEGRRRPQLRKSVALDVNGRTYTLELDSRCTLAEALREELGLTGTKLGCDMAECGTCTVIVDGRAIFACALLAVETEGRRIETIEGLSRGGKLHPIQEAFIEEDALQCGFCIPGMIMSVKALLNRNSHPSEEELRHAIAGNYCRCGAYPNIIKAALSAAATLRGATLG